MAGGGGGSMPGQGGQPGLLAQLFKPMMTGKGDPLGLMPEDQPVSPFLRPMTQQPNVGPTQETDRLAFLRAFGVQ
jgi:hypothetical protein